MLYLSNVKKYHHELLIVDQVFQTNLVLVKSFICNTESSLGK